MERKKRRKRVFVQVGSTSFDALIQRLDSPEAIAALQAQGYGEMVLQIGRGEHIPRESVESSSSSSSDFSVSYFRYKDTLSDEVASADLIISHAGSGSVFETLGQKKPLIVVINESLMDNHQAELAEELAALGCLVCARCSDLVDRIRELDLSKLTPYGGGNPEVLAEAIEATIFQ